jgi:hypothetical protein
MACILFGKIRFLKLATFFSTKILVSLVRAFYQVHFFWQSKLFAKSVFSKGFGKFLALRFGKSVVFSKAKIRLVKN